MYLLFKNAFVKVKKSLGRFISLLLIVALGVGFFVGIRASSPSMIDSIDKYDDDNDLMDFKIQSTMGITDGDIESLKELKNLNIIAPSYTLDVLSDGTAIRVHSILDEINKVTLIEGRMPSSLDECLADSKKYNVGDVIQIDSNVDENLKNSKYTVVGTINSVLYLFNDYGISSVGNGKLFSYIYIPKDNFTMKYYTEVYITANKTKEAKIYSDEYEKYSGLLEDELLNLKPIRETIRYEEILEEATTKIQDEENKFHESRDKGAKELSDAKAKLDDSKEALSNAKWQIEKNSTDLNNTITEKNSEFTKAKKDIESAWNQINTNLDNYSININEIDSKITELENNINSLNILLTTLQQGTQQYIETESNIIALQNIKAQMTALSTSINELKSQEEKLNNGIAEFNNQISEAKQKISNGRQEIKTNEGKLNAGYEEYSLNLDKFNKEIEDASQKINKAKEEIKTIEKPKWYLLDRTDNKGYIEIKEDAQKVSLIAEIFPIFFMLVVALMSLNTMVRMIEEERSEIGTLTSLGFGDFKITLVYIIYVLLSTSLGMVGGYFIGNGTIPEIIYSVYNSNYILPPFIVNYNIGMLFAIIAIVLALMIGVTVIACYNELKNKPANLLRPVAPKKGKKIFLEKIGFIWKKLSFTWKVTSRNMFRYKKRVFMIIIGIAGCTALLLTGFGIRDSIDGIADLQFKKTFKYDSLIALDKEVETLDIDLKNTLDNEKVINPLLIYQTNFTFDYKDKKLDTYLIVPEDENAFYNYFTLKSKISGSIVTLPENGVLITEKMASLLGIGKNGTLKIRSSDNTLYVLNVVDIIENYTFHYIYMNKQTYENIFDNKPTFNLIVADINNDESTIAKNLIASEKVSYINFTTDNLNSFNTLISGLNSIIYLIIAASSLLALIVLYNLTAINISERKREIATLKVLGFYDNEVSQYIYRETFILTLIGIIAGLILGVFLHQFIIRLVEIDSTVFIKAIKPISFIYSFLITLVFTFTVQIITHFKLKKIDMTGSLKSVE